MNDIRVKFNVLDMFKLAIAFLGFFAFLLNPRLGTQGIINGLNLCYTSIIPALFPFFVFSKLIMHSKYSFVPGLIFYPYSRYLLKIRHKNTGTAILLGLFGGFGCGAVCVKSLYAKKNISLSEAHVLLCMIINAGPAFVVACVGTILLKSTITGWLIYISLCASSLITGIIFAVLANFKNKTECKKKKGHKKTPPPLTVKDGDDIDDDSNKFVHCVKDAVFSTLTLCGFVVVFSFFMSCISVLNLPAWAQILVAILTEVTVANSLIAQSINAKTVYLCCCAISVMGASILLQVRSLLPSEISVLPVLMSRFIHAPVSLLCLHVLLILFNNAVPASAQTIYKMRMPLDAACAAIFFCCAFFCSFKTNQTKKI